jgi:Xaa-Pro aminopeptidase
MAFQVPEELSKTCAALRSAGVDFALLTTLPNVTYVSGWDVPPAFGPAAELTGWLPNGCVVVNAKQDAAWLVVSDLLSAPASRANRLEYQEVFSGFGHFEPVDAAQSFRETLAATLRAAGVQDAGSTLGVESHSLPLTVYRLLQGEFANVRIGDASACLDQARRIKTAREVDLVRKAVAVADAAQHELIRQARRSDLSDLDVWDSLAGAMERCVGHVVPNVAELVTGPRTASVAPGGPVGRQIEAGDTGLLDISPRVDGYWADCTNTVVFGREPTLEQRRYFRAARDACEAGMEALRPGRQACDVCAAVARTLQQHGFPVAHYSGHQVGASLNERPRLVPYDMSTIEAGMIFAVEPGAYGGETSPTGARAEKVVLVTETGPEILSDFPWGF